MEKYEQMLETALEKIPKRESTRERFQIPEVISEVQGNKTLIRNFIEIADTLRKDPNHLARYLFKELATPGNIQGSTLILQTKLSKDAIQKKIGVYVSEYVYCKICGEPDTKFVKEGRVTLIRCEACGGTSPYKPI